MRVTKKLFFVFLLLAILYQPRSSFAGLVTVSTGLSVTATVGAGGGGSSGGTGGGGGGGGYYPAPASIIFSGRAYPLSKVILLEDGQEIIQTISGPDAKFSIAVSNLTTGTYTFSLLAEDSNLRRSAIFTIPVKITYGLSTTVSGIFLSPTIEINKQNVKRGDTITIFGQSIPDANVTISVHSNKEIFLSTPTDQNGVYLYNLNTAPLEYGGHIANSKAEITKTNEITNDSPTVSFNVNTKDIKEKVICGIRGDLNADCRVNLVDFSIMAYWYRKHNVTPPARIDLNMDGKITIVDFSILIYYWTG